ncbi:MAG: hypothetical protein ACT4PP_05800 [Sporichthyaceae bacterium]
MVGTLGGRIQTRIFLLLVVGGIWTLLVTPVLPGVNNSDLSGAYHATYVVLIAVAVLGVGWEFLYHFLQQFRWEKDWPTLFGLLTAINEGLLIWILVKADWLPTDPVVPGRTFLVVFITTWLWVWLSANGPMRVPFVRWRFRGGRVLG